MYALLLFLLTGVCVLAMVIVSVVVDPDFGPTKAALTFAKLWAVAMVRPTILTAYEASKALRRVRVHTRALRSRPGATRLL